LQLRDCSRTLIHVNNYNTKEKSACCAEQMRKGCGIDNVVSYEIKCTSEQNIIIPNYMYRIVQLLYSAMYIYLLSFLKD